MNLDDFSYAENDRRYVNPQVSLDESNAFIENLRNAQGQDTAQIRQDTYNLGTAVPSNLGGLSGGSGYFASRYQTPQMNSMVADLRAAAQSKALSTLMQNEIDKAQKRYKDVYRAYKKKEALDNKNNGAGDISDELEKMRVTTNTNGPEKEKISEDPHKVFGFSVDNIGNTVYNDGLGRTYRLQNLTPADRMSVSSRLPNNATDGTMVEVNGKTYIYSTASGGNWYQITGKKYTTKTKDGESIDIYLPY